MILSFLFFAFLAYVLFKLVTDFIIPVYRTTRKVKKSFREMQEKMKEQQTTSASYHDRQQSTEKKQEPLGDYIDFEEVKD